MFTPKSGFKWGPDPVGFRLPAIRCSGPAQERALQHALTATSIEFNSGRGILMDMGRLQPMKRVIRDTKTGKYFKAGDWTEDFDQATNFDSIPEAVRECSRYTLKNTELVLFFGHKKMDVAVPICR